MWSLAIFSAGVLLSSFTTVFGLLILAVMLDNVINYRRNQLVNKISGPKTTFLFGNALSVIGKREDIFQNGQQLREPYLNCPLARFWVGPWPQIVVHDVHSIEAILSSNKLIDKANIYNYMKPWLGVGLLISSGKKWQVRRKLITPSFHFRILEEFLPIINEQSEILASILKQFDGKATFDIHPYLSRCTLDIICETAMGKRIQSQRNAESEYVKAVQRMLEIIKTRVITPWLMPNFLFYLSSSGWKHQKCLKILHKFTNEVINERRNEFLEIKKQPNNSNSTEDNEIFGKKRRLAFLDMLLESSIEGKGLSNADIREEVDTFMFEGHDTTSSGINFAIFNIGRFPEIQKKIHEELDNVFGNSNRPITTEDLAKLKFLECVIKESMRLFPPVPFFGRVFKEDVKIGDYVIPAGVDVIFPVHSIHRNDEQFPDPEKFDPDRFLPENSTKRHPYAYIPFSAGPRNCIGQKFAMMEEKIILSHVMRRFKVTSMQKLEDLKLASEVVFRPLDGIRIKIESR